MKIKTMHLAMAILIFIFGSIASTSALGLWKTTNDKIPDKYKEGEFLGQYNPADIRGSYSFGDIVHAFEIPIEDLGRAFGIQNPSEYSSFQCKELESLYSSLAEEEKEIGTGSVRYFVALYKGLPIDAEEDTFLPEAAVDILKEKASLTKEQINTIEKYSVALPDISQPSQEIPSTVDIPSKSEASNTKIVSQPETGSAETTSQPVPSTDHDAVEDRSIKGKTTFKELLDWGIKKEDIEKAIQGKMPDSDKIIKDYATDKGIEFSAIKEPLQLLIDADK